MKINKIDDHSEVVYYSKYASIMHIEIDSNRFREEIEEIYVKLVYLKLKNKHKKRQNRKTNYSLSHLFN
jgi:hypothetical protein